MAALARWLQRVLVALLVFTALGAAAQDDPPGRVGRVADVEGQVWYYDLESGDWIPAALNRPLTTGDRVATDADGRAELRIGSTTLRLAAGTEIDVLQLDDERVRVELLSGRLALRLRAHETAREFELVSAEGRFLPELAGRYELARIDAKTYATVWSGQMPFQAPDDAATLVAGQRIEVIQAFGRTQYITVAAQRDAFTDEVAAADAAAERSISTTRYVSPEMTGAESLDAYGRWENDADYGALWVPRAVVPGWAPYRYGHWAWVRPWGWTWVDDAPWGFAPFHYGRWVFWRSRWCWAPGTWVARPVFAPALVGWVGAPLVGVSIGISPSVGWFPLGPREVFVPPYRVSPRYVRSVNITHVTNITNVTQIINSPNTVVQQINYVNRGLPSAVTVVPAHVVSNRQPVAPARVQLTDPHPGTPAGRATALSVQAQAPVTAIAPVPAPTRRRPTTPVSTVDAGRPQQVQAPTQARPHPPSPAQAQPPSTPPAPPRSAPAPLPPVQVANTAPPPAPVTIVAPSVPSGAVPRPVPASPVAPASPQAVPAPTVAAAPPKAQPAVPSPPSRPVPPAVPRPAPASPPMPAAVPGPAPQHVAPPPQAAPAPVQVPTPSPATAAPNPGKPPPANAPTPTRPPKDDQRDSNKPNSERR